MTKKKKIVLQALLFFSILFLTIWGIFHDENLPELLDAIQNCSVPWLIPAVICVLLFIFGESIIIWYLMRVCGIKLKKWICFLFSSVGFFFSCVTPSASGGQPMQVYFMRKEKIPVPIATIILLIITITYKAVLVVIGLALMLFGQNFLQTYLTDVLPVFYLGIVLNIGCVAVMAVLVFHPSLCKRVLIAGFHLLEKLHILKPKEHKLTKLEASMDSYHDTARFVKSHKWLMLQVLVITFLQRIALFAVPCFIYKAFHQSGVSWITILLLQASISVSVDMLPLPGGMGISETLFLIIFAPIFGEFLLPGMVVSRGIGYYSELLFSAIFTLVAVVIFSHRSHDRRS